MGKLRPGEGQGRARGHSAGWGCVAGPRPLHRTPQPTGSRHLGRWIQRPEQSPPQTLEGANAQGPRGDRTEPRWRAAASANPRGQGGLGWQTPAPAPSLPSPKTGPWEKLHRDRPRSRLPPSQLRTAPLQQAGPHHRHPHWAPNMIAPIRRIRRPGSERQTQLPEITQPGSSPAPLPKTTARAPLARPHPLPGAQTGSGPAGAARESPMSAAEGCVCVRWAMTSTAQAPAPPQDLLEIASSPTAFPV